MADPTTAELHPHAWRAPFSAASGMCGALVMRNGGGDECGLPRDHPVHATAATIYAAERPAPVVKELPRTNVTRKCGVCGDFASSVITFYRRNPFDHTAWRPAQHDRCRRHTPATEGAQ